MRRVYYLFLLILINPGLFAQHANEKGVGQNSTMAVKLSVLNGNWTTGATWGGTAPAGYDDITVATAVVVNTNIAITGTLTVGATGTLIDAAGGTKYTLDVSSSGVLNIYGNTTFEGAVHFQNNAVIHIYAPSVVNFGSFLMENNVVFTIDAGATLNVNGNMTLQNNNAMAVNGTINVIGNLSTSNNATSAGSTGTITTTGTMTTANGSDIMGFTGDCTAGPCVAAPGLFGTLPVELTTFTAVANKGGVQLDWSTANEHNNNYFSVERGLNGTDFEEIIKVGTKAAGGNSSEQLNYTYTDTDPIVGSSYYRLKQTDVDGEYEYFTIISVDYLPAVDVKFTVYPNPNSGEFFVDFSGIENNHEVEIFLHGANGKTLFSSKFYVQDSKNESIKISPDEKLSPGVYFCSLVSEGIRSSVKVMVN